MKVGKHERLKVKGFGFSRIPNDFGTGYVETRMAEWQYRGVDVSKYRKILLRLSLNVESRLASGQAIELVRSARDGSISPVECQFSHTFRTLLLHCRSPCSADQSGVEAPCGLDSLLFLSP